MAMTAVCMGTLVADPVRRTTEAGRPFVTASLRVPVDDGDAFLASLICFSTTAGEALAALGKGDQCVVGGRAGLKSWEGRDGETKHGIGMVVEQVLSPYKFGKRRKAAAGDAATDETA